MKFLKKQFLLFLLLVIAFQGCKSDAEKKVTHFEKGKTYYEKGEYKSAELEFKNALQIDPEYAEVYTNLGQTYLKLGNAQGAFQAYSKAVKFNPDDLDAHLKLATFFFFGRKLKEAKENVDTVLSKEADNIEALFLFAGICEQEKNLDESVATFKKIIDIDSKQIRAYLGLARVWIRQEKYSEA